MHRECRRDQSESKTVTGQTDSHSSGGVVGPIPTPTPTPEPEPIPTPTPEPPKKTKFDDISGTFNKDEIQLLTDQGVIQGVSLTKFEPQRAITRAEYTALIVRLLGIDTKVPYDDTFQRSEIK